MSEKIGKHGRTESKRNDLKEKSKSPIPVEHDLTSSSVALSSDRSSRLQLTPDHTSIDSTTTASAWEAASSSPSSSEQPTSQCQSPTNSLSAALQSGSNSSGATSCLSTAAQLGANDLEQISPLDDLASSSIQVGQVYLTRRADGTLHPAQVIQERSCEFGRSEFYVHYVGLNRRLDQWVVRSRIMSLSPGSAAANSDSTPSIGAVAGFTPAEGSTSPRLVYAPNQRLSSKYY